MNQPTTEHISTAEKWKNKNVKELFVNTEIELNLNKYNPNIVSPDSSTEPLPYQKSKVIPVLSAKGTSPNDKGYVQSGLVHTVVTPKHMEKVATFREEVKNERQETIRAVTPKTATKKYTTLGPLEEIKIADLKHPQEEPVQVTTTAIPEHRKVPFQEVFRTAAHITKPHEKYESTYKSDKKNVAFMDTAAHIKHTQDEPVRISSPAFDITGRSRAQAREDFLQREGGRFELPIKPKAQIQSVPLYFPKESPIEPPPFVACPPLPARSYLEDEIAHHSLYIPPTPGYTTEYASNYVWYEGAYGAPAPPKVKSYPLQSLPIDSEPGLHPLDEPTLAKVIPPKKFIKTKIANNMYPNMSLIKTSKPKTSKRHNPAAKTKQEKQHFDPRIFYVTEYMRAYGCHLR